jgi:predicted protein tyrosine phosphatase
VAIEEPGVQVFGQMELVSHLGGGGFHYSHCVSIGNPKRWFHPRAIDQIVPALFYSRFQGLLRLEFYDVERKSNLPKWKMPKRVPTRSDVKSAISFFWKTRGVATGYTLHCWQGISRSTAFALGYLFLITKSEEEAGALLQRIRPEASPHPLIVLYFDQELGCNLSEQARQIRSFRMREMSHGLEGTEAELEELPQ